MRRLPLFAVLLLSAATPLSAAPRYGTWGLDYANMDKAVKPGDDFFAYTEGSWVRDHPIPADKTGAGYNYELPDDTDVQVRGLVEQAEKAPADATQRQIGDFYAAWMDQPAIEARGLAPLKPYLATIAAIGDRKQLAHLFFVPGYPAPFGFDIITDFKDPTHYVPVAIQGELGLPARDYYLLKDAKYVTIRAQYRAYIVKIETLAGVADPEKKADAFLALETRLAQGQWAPEKMRDPVATYNPMTRAQLAALAPQYDWDAALAKIGLAKAPLVDVMTPSSIADLGKAIDDVPLQTWKDYLAFRFISDNAAYLPKAFDAAHFDFYSHTLRGVETQRDRWKRGMALLDQNLGEAVGQLYAAKYWSPETERQSNEMMADMRAAYGDLIAKAAWMDEPTRKEALAKLAAFDPRVGHPVRYIDYSSYRVSRTDPLANAVASADFEWRLKLSRLPKPVDRALWDMHPQTVNAEYDPSLNQVTIPAAEIQAPFLDPQADAAANYAGLGATIGHEMGHGFDDEGRQFDAQGRLRDWWTAQSAARYKTHADRLARQFDGYEPIPGTHIKGDLTLGENLADLGGLEAAYAAYRRYVSRHGEPKVIDGYTGDQRFFLAYAQSWQGKRREGAERAQLLADPHSPDKYRVNGIVRNFDPWYKAFDVRPGEALYLAPDQRVRVW